MVLEFLFNRLCHSLNLCTQSWLRFLSDQIDSIFISTGIINIMGIMDIVGIITSISSFN